MTNGTGKISEKSFWLNLADKSLRNTLMHLPKQRGSALVAVNEWLSYFNVRVNHLEILAGREAIIKVEPTSHVATESFRELKRRKCIFRDEKPVNIWP